MDQRDEDEGLADLLKMNSEMTEGAKWFLDEERNEMEKDSSSSCDWIKPAIVE